MPPPASASSASPVPHALAGISLMVGGIFLMTVMDAFGKHLVSGSVALVQIFFVRSALICATMLFSVVVSGQTHRIATTRPWAQWLRGLIGASAPLCFFYALSSLPVADAHVIGYSSTFMIVILSAWLLRERIGIHRWSAVVFGFAGVLIAVGFSGSGEIGGYLLILVSAAAYSALFLSAKWLSRTETSLALVFWYNLGVGSVCLVALPWQWQAMSAGDAGGIVVFAMLALAGQYCMTKAYTLADASLLTSFEYTSLVWAAAIDYLVWQHSPRASIVLGGAIIVASSLYVAHRERQRHRSPPADHLQVPE